MRPLRIMEHISLDGVIQHSADENGFPHSDWSALYRTPAGREMLAAAFGESFDLLLGRRTYDLWAGVWSKAPAHPLADRINAATKYVATHRAESLDWGPHEAAGPDVAEDVRRIKAQPGPDLVLWGSSTLAAPLLRHGLVEELVLIVYPLVLGTGKRLFAEEIPAASLELVSTQATPTGVLLNAYRVSGPLKAL